MTIGYPTVYVCKYKLGILADTHYTALLNSREALCRPPALWQSLSVRFHNSRASYVISKTMKLIMPTLPCIIPYKTSFTAACVMVSDTYTAQPAALTRLAACLEGNTSVRGPRTGKREERGPGRGPVSEVATAGSAAAGPTFNMCGAEDETMQLDVKTMCIQTVADRGFGTENVRALPGRSKL